MNSYWLKIIKNKKNKQLSLIIPKKEISKHIKLKLNNSNRTRVRLEDFDF